MSIEESADMGRLAAVERAGRAAGILIRMSGRWLGGKFTVPLSINVSGDYCLHAERDGDEIANALYASMYPHLALAIEAARERLRELVAAAGAAVPKEG